MKYMGSKRILLQNGLGEILEAEASFCHPRGRLILRWRFCVMVCRNGIEKTRTCMRSSTVRSCISKFGCRAYTTVCSMTK